MPKMKTKKCAVKRMKLSKSGKVLRSQGGHAHLNNGKKRNRKNNLCGRTVVESQKVTKTYAMSLTDGKDDSIHSQQSWRHRTIPLQRILHG